MAIERRHPGSLLPKEHHNPNLVWLMQQPVDRSMIRHIVAEVEKVIVIDNGSSSAIKSATASLPSPPVTPIKGDFATEVPAPTPPAPTPIPTLEEFIVILVKRSNVQASTLLSTLVYFSKLRSKLPRMAKGGMPCTRHRVFLATLIVAAKYLNDSSPKNKYWTSYAQSKVSDANGSTTLFGFEHAEVNLMEKQLLFLLDYDLHISEDELVDILGVFFPGGARAGRRRPAPILITPKKLAPTLPLTPVSPVPPVRPQIALQTKVNMDEVKEDDGLSTSSGSCSPSPMRATFAMADLVKRELATTAHAGKTRSDAIARLRQNPSIESLADSVASVPSLDHPRVTSYGLSRTSTASSSASSSSASLTDGSSATESEAMLSSASSGSEQEDPEICMPHIVQRQARIAGGSMVNSINVDESDDDTQSCMANDTVGKGARRRFILRGVPTSAFRPTADRQRVPSSSSTITSPKNRGSRFYSSINARESPSAPSFTRAPGTMPLRVTSKSFAPKSRVASLASQKDYAEQNSMPSTASLPSLAIRARDTLGRVWGGFRGTDSLATTSSSKGLAHSKSTAYLGVNQQRTSSSEWRLRNASASSAVPHRSDEEDELVQQETFAMEVDVVSP